MEVLEVKMRIEQNLTAEARKDFKGGCENLLGILNSRVSDLVGWFYEISELSRDGEERMILA